MLRKIYICIVIISLSLSISCDSIKKQNKFEDSILNQVFYDLTDSLIYYVSFPPPPPPPEVDSEGKIVDTSNIVLYRKLIARIDTTRKVISISDSTKMDVHFKEYIDLFQSYFDTIGFHLNISELIKSTPEKRELNVDKIINTGKYELMKLSDLNSIQTNHPFLEYYFTYFGDMTLSRLYFNKPHDMGFFTCKINGRFFHYSFLIIVEKNSSKWTIKKMKRLSIA